jgi:hypothetical protein
MINWKVFGKKRSWTKFEVLSRQLPGKTDENNEKVRIAGLRAVI